MKSMKLLTIILSLGITLGCGSMARYTEGQHLGLGIYIPVEGEMVGLNVADYLSGIAVRCPSNQCMTVTREFNSSNTYFGVVHINEKT